MEKTIVSKIGLFDILAMLLPGLVILWGVEIINPSWIQCFYNLPEMHSAFWRNTAFVFAALLVGGMWHTIMDILWHVLHLRNSSCMIRGAIHFLRFHHRNEYPKEIVDEILHKEGILRDYFMNYKDVAKECGEKMAAVEKQVVMFRNLILPAAFLTYIIIQSCQSITNYAWCCATGIGLILLLFTLLRQMRVYYVYYDYYIYMGERLEKVKKATTETFSYFWQWIKMHVGTILLVAAVIVFLVLVILVSSFADMTKWAAVLSFCISLVATFVGVFLVYSILHPKLRINDQFEVNTNDILNVCVTNESLFKAYNIKAYLDFCRDDADGEVIVKNVPLRRDSVGVIYSRFSPLAKKEYIFKTTDTFSWDGAVAKYSRIRFRVVATHQISNVIREFEKECMKEDIMYLKH